MGAGHRGTIAGTGASATDLSNYRSAVLLGEELVRSVPAIKQFADVRVEQPFNIASYDITVAHWITLANRINQIFSDDPSAAGIVVTHGTSTLEETAYFLNLTVKHDRPVVLVGSMRPATAIIADGPLNLLNAVRTAAAPDARGKGVLVVMNDQINAAREVTKTNTMRVETFRSPDFGLLGYVDADKVAFYRTSTRRHTAASEFDVSARTNLPTVEVVYAYAQSSTDVLPLLIEKGAEGIVFAGTGPGSLSAAQVSVIKAALDGAAASRPVIVRSSRSASGRISARDAFETMGMIAGDNLTPQKARILLMLALMKTRDSAEIRRMFSEY